MSPRSQEFMDTARDRLQVIAASVDSDATD